MKQINKVLIVVFVVCASISSTFAEGSSVLRSCVFPGMGQLGNGQKVKGLIYMVGEVSLLSATFAEIARSNSYARHTQYLKIQYNSFDNTTEQHQLTFDSWKKSTDDSKNAQLMAAGFGGAAVLLWAWNIVDSFLFIPAESDEVSLFNNIRDNLVVASNGKNAIVSYKIDF